MKIKTMLKVILLIAFSQTVNSQEKKSLDLKVGDTMPDVTFSNLINYQSSTAKLSDFKGRLVVLDFWYTKCGACVAAFPKMTALQNKFRNEMQVLLVNTQLFDTKERIDKTFAKQKSLGNEVTLPYLYGDTVLEKYIAYRYLPHLVWIDGNRKIVAVTSAEEATEETIKALLRKEKTNVGYKRDDMTFDIDKPFFVNNNGNPDGVLLFKSTLTKYNSGFIWNAPIIQKYQDTLLRFRTTNAILLTIYDQIFAIVSVPDNRRIYETSKAHKFAKAETKAHLNSYCYEFIAKANSEDDFKSLIRRDLAGIFKVDVVKEMKLRDVYVLKKKSGADMKNEQKEGFKPLKNVVFLKRLNSAFDFPVVDETKEHATIVNVPANYDEFNVEQLSSMLSDLGYTLQKDKREIEMVVFKDII
jgi:thiol-disulfide isomerase/thioredoxin